MKIIRLSCALIFGTTVFFSSCKKDDPQPTIGQNTVAQPIKIRASSLRGNWKTSSVSINAQSITSEYGDYVFELAPNNVIRVIQRQDLDQKAGGSWVVAQDSMSFSLNFTGNEPKLTTLSGEYSLLGFTVDLWTISRKTIPSAQIQFTGSK